MNSKTGFTPFQGPGLALQQCVDRFCALVLRTKLIIFPLFEVEQILQLHQGIHKSFPQNSTSSSICWCMKWLVAKRPKLIVLLFELQLRVIAKQRNEFLRATYCLFMADIPRKCYCRPFLLFRSTSPCCGYNLWIFETNAVLVKRTFIWLFYLSSSRTNIGDKSPATSSLRAEPS